MLVAVVLFVFPIAACNPSDNGTPSVTPPPTTSAIDNGRNIYFYSTSTSGEYITYTGGPGTMMRLTCASCHGDEGHGGQIFFMMQSFDVPNITWADLTGQHESHPPFTIETVKQAITQGVDPAGNPLDYQMPLWQMSEGNLNDLVAFIQTLE